MATTKTNAPQNEKKSTEMRGKWELESSDNSDQTFWCVRPQSILLVGSRRLLTATIYAPPSSSECRMMTTLPDLLADPGHPVRRWLKGICCHSHENEFTHPDSRYRSYAHQTILIFIEERNKTGQVVRGEASCWMPSACKKLHQLIGHHALVRVGSRCLKQSTMNDKIQPNTTLVALSTK